MAKPTYPIEKVAPTYRPLWDRAKINAAGSRVTAAANLVLAGKSRYLAVEAATGAPWWWVGVIHYRESACDFAGVLHNGEEIIGTGRKTTLVPEGRGPFKTWQAGAIDALLIKGIKPGSHVWTLGTALYKGEEFNGFGYRARRTPSAYLWSGTTIYMGGKYIRDHVWSPTAMDKQLGIVPIIMKLMELDDSVRFADEAEVIPAGPAAASATDAPAPAEINPDDGLSKGEIEALQQRLRDLGYSEVGRVDGKWGPRTIAAVSAFQATSGLPVTGELDKATAAALTTSGPRPVSAERKSTTATDLRKAGDPVAKASFLNKVCSAVAGFFALIFGAAQESGTAVGYLSPVREFVTDVPPMVWFGAVATVAAVIWWQANRAERAAVADVRSGRDAGPA
ncbi:Peptidoglycan-binding domain 1 protein [Xanthobacter versatilis]|uniref:Peptidoglycan-binding domain 1 protein n=1 Tax=Xanthobacter autotrophicus (strain ATCC BAA-1158 / Py2) TaxID=78245 RepID=A7ILQ9_XANP2|nr:Peptidoglycan-binding domain 1 protein [Xanthobacter autotrophicus Py2]